MATPQDKASNVAPISNATQAPATAPEVAPETPEETEIDVKKTWTENFNVKESVDVETIDRLTIKVGINEYKGNTGVFIAKVTDKNFSRSFFALPAHVWEKAIPLLQKITPKVAEVEKRTMVENATKELQRLKDMGVDVSAILKSLQAHK